MVQTDRSQGFVLLYLSNVLRKGSYYLYFINEETELQGISYQITEPIDDKAGIQIKPVLIFIYHYIYISISLYIFEDELNCN